tara:strand:- start:1191 stop:2111 length:921 start_codon:yes stop_codon:yes gene_type:complete
METKSRQKSPKIAKKFYCEFCFYECSKESDFKKHLATRKHQKMVDGNKWKHDGNKNSPIHQCSVCFRTFSSRAGLWKHMKASKCLQEKSVVSEGSGEFKDLVLLLLKENKEIQKNFLELIPQIKGNAENSFNTTYSNTNNTNNFNIQMFLNNHCKNAMNLTDFINSLPITNETYDNTIENGLTKTLASMITNGLSNMDILERPIHCTDPVRKTMYVKDNDVWEKDKEFKMMVKGIKSLSLKQRTNLSKWQDANEGWDKDENLQTRMTKLVFNSMTSIEEDEKETNKIIKAIGKNTYLSNTIKDEYK